MNADAREPESELASEPGAVPAGASPAGASPAGSDGALRGDRLLRQIIEVVSGDLDLGGIVQRVAELVTETTGCDICFVHLLDEERSLLTLAGATPPFDELAGSVELLLGEGVAGWVAQHGEPAVLQDKWADPRYRYIPALKGEDYATMVSVPMIHRGGTVVGVVNMHSRTRREFSDADVSLFCDVAHLLAGAVENARLYSRLADREDALERFAAKVVEAQELERRRLAGDLHDGISQRLVGLWFHLSAASDATGDDWATVSRQLAAAKQLAAEALDETRVAIAGLRPAVLDDLGLGPSLESLAHGLGDVELEIDVDPCRLAPHVETALFRIAQEALQNVVKHASATRVRVELRCDDPGGGVTLVVSDDGRGFDTSAVAESSHGFSYGLASMRERAELIEATFRITSAPGRGTTLVVTLPGAQSRS
ncbi:MAG TPA: GAF domain-containing sensor histidine kinase [Acidimicrobiales bacterium]|nr:GAF domain-containing sensor histidine kinase [Acidimicrobiales bacterium]